MDRTGREQRSQGHRWWQDWRWVASVAALLLTVAFGTFVVTTVANDVKVEERSQVIEHLDDLAVANAAAIAQIERNQSGIDELVAFVHDLQVRADPRVDRQVFVDLLCASEDPTRLAACARIEATP